MTLQLVSSTEYRLRCTNSAGATEDSTTVGILAPTMTFTATPTVVNRGEPVTLAWQTTGLGNCNADWGGPTTDRPPNGSEQVIPSARHDLIFRWRFTLRCSAPGGIFVSRSVDVKVKVFAGKLLFPPRVDFDNDVNDPDAQSGTNDTFDEAGHFSWLHVMPGYVNQPLTGSPGRSHASGDLTDFHRTDSFSSGTLTLRLTMPGIDMNEPVGQRADADLYIYRSNGQLIDASVGTGREEVLTVPANDSFRIEVRSVTGAVTYLLEYVSLQMSAGAHASRLSAEFVPGEVLVTLDGPRAASQSSKTPGADGLAQYGLRQLGGAPSREIRAVMAADPVTAMQSLGHGRAHLVPAGTSMSDEQARRLATLLYVKQLQAMPGVRHAAPNRIYRSLAIVPDDPLYLRQRWHYEMIRLPEAWEISTGSPSVTVAIVDTGIARGHSELEPRIRDGYDMVSDPGNPDQNGPDPDFDDHGFFNGSLWIYHGTHVAGTIGAVGNNGNGVTGVAWNVGLMPLRVLNGNSGTLYDVLQGVRYAAGLPNDSGRVPAPRADVINLSLGGPGDCEPLEAAVFEQVRAAGVLVAASAGNGGGNMPYAPASCPGVLSVASVGGTGVLAAYSNYGQHVDLSAPGGDLRFDTDGDGFLDGVMSTHADGPHDARSLFFGTLQGTSMAAPHVSGVLALMKGLNPALAPGDIEQLLAAGALTDDVEAPGRDNFGYGTLNALEALRAAQGIFDASPALVTSPKALNLSGSIPYVALFLSNDGGGVLTVTALQPTVPWLSVQPVAVDANGLGTYQVRADMSQVPINTTLHGTLEIDTTAGTRVLAAQVTEGLSHGVSFYPLYLEIVDAITGARVRSLTAGTFTEQHRFRIDDLPPGRYYVVAGTDLNNDERFCDPGEVCGIYPLLGALDAVDYVDTTDEVDVLLMLSARRLDAEVSSQ